MTDHRRDDDVRDALVGAALRDLDVPDHAAGFWEDLEARLTTPAPGETRSDDEPRDDAETDDPEPASAAVVDLADGSARRAHTGHRGTPAWLLAAAVVAIAALVVGVGVLRTGSSEDSVVDIADEPGGDATAPDDAPDADDAPAPSPAVAPSPAEAIETADAWLAAIGAGDIEAAHAVLDATARRQLSLDAFGDVATGLAEGAAAFATPDVARTTATLEGAPRPATVVVYTGEVEREGMIETAAYPVVVTRDGSDPATLGIGFFLDGPAVEAEQVAPGETRTSPLRLTLDGASRQTWSIIDSMPARRLAGDSVGLDVAALAGAGTHTVTVVSAQDGRFTARAYTVVVP